MTKKRNVAIALAVGLLLWVGAASLCNNLSTQRGVSLSSGWSSSNQGLCVGYVTSPDRGWPLRNQSVRGQECGLWTNNAAQLLNALIGLGLAALAGLLLYDLLSLRKSAS